MTLEKILILGIALLVIGGVYSFGSSLITRTQDATEMASDNQDGFEADIGDWSW
jgi:hypothetical protein